MSHSSLGFGPLTVNKPSHPQAEEAWSLQPELHRATAPPRGHNIEENDNQVSVQAVVLHHPELNHYAN